MFTINGIFLFKIYTLTVMYELFNEKILLPQIQNARLSVDFQMFWIQACASFMRINNIESLMAVIDFCLLLFRAFQSSQKNIYTSTTIKMQSFCYDTSHDATNGFIISRFIKFLAKSSLFYDNQVLYTLREDIIKLLHNVQNVQANESCNKEQLMIIFQEYKKYRALFQRITTQYEFLKSQDNNYKICIYSLVSKSGDLDICLTTK